MSLLFRYSLSLWHHPTPDFSFLHVHLLRRVECLSVSTQCCLGSAMSSFRTHSTPRVQQQLNSLDDSWCLQKATIFLENSAKIHRRYIHSIYIHTVYIFDIKMWYLVIVKINIRITHSMRGSAINIKAGAITRFIKVTSMTDSHRSMPNTYLGVIRRKCLTIRVLYQQASTRGR